MNNLINLALLLFGAKVGGVIFSKLKQPSIVGELVAGIILGPSILALVGPSNLLTVVSDLGLLFLILLVSLSIDWKILEGSTEKYVWIEIMRIAVTFGLVYGVMMVFSWSIYTFMVAGFIMVMSSTAIVSRTLNDTNNMHTKEGQSLMCIEVVDKVFAIIAVALLAHMMAGQAITIEPMITTILVVVGLFVVMSRVGTKFINRLTGSIQKYGIEEALLAFTLLLAFSLGGMTESLNLASVLGVFMAGMILSRSAQFPVITRKVKEIGESFFIPIFFASVGLTINLYAAMQYANVIVMLVGIIVTVKMATSMIVLRFFHYQTEQSVKIGSGLVSMSEMTIVIAALAVSKLSPAIYVGLIASFLIINMISPLFMNFAFRNGLSSFIKFASWMSPQRDKWKVYKHARAYSAKSIPKNNE